MFPDDPTKGIPEGAPAPDMPPEDAAMQDGPPPGTPADLPPEFAPMGGPPMPEQPMPEQPVADPYGEGQEIEVRERLSIELASAATDMALACKMMREENDAERAEKFATAAQRLTQAHVLLAPLEASDDLATGQVGASPERAQLADSASKGMRRSAQ